MDDIYAINRAKTAFREAFNAGDLEGTLAVFSPALTNWCEGLPSFFGPEGRASLRMSLEELFCRYHVEIAPVVIDIKVNGDTAYDYGWHKIWMTAKGASGERTMIKERYFELWRRQADGAWQIELLMTNQEERPQMLPGAGGTESFLYAAGMSY